MMVSIRRATVKDYDAMLRMARDFTAEHPSGDPVDADQFAQYFEASLPGHPMVMLVATQHGQPCGMLFGLVYPPVRCVTGASSGSGARLTLTLLLRG